MDPILTRAARRLMRQVDVAERTGIDFTPDMQEQFMRENTNGKYGVQEAFDVVQGINTDFNPRNLGRSVVQGALFNFGDELLGLVSPGKKEEMRLREDLYAKEHPVLNALGQIGGGLVVPGAGAMKAAGSARSLPGAVARGAGIGAGSGALAGAGMGETAGERVSGATAGAMGGAAIGGALPAVLGPLRSLTSASARADRRIGDAVHRAGGVDKLRASNKALDAAGRGGDTIFADLSPETQLLLDFVANNDEKGFVAAKTLTSNRQSFMSDRLLADVKRLLGNPHASSELRRMKKELADFAASDKGYEGLRQNNPQLQNVHALGELEAFFKQPRVRRLWADAKDEGLVGDEPKLSHSFELLQNMKEKLQRAIDHAWDKKGTRTLARGLGEVRDAVDGALEKMVPGYKEVNAVYREGMAAQKALVLGTKWVHKADEQELMYVVSNMQPGELDAFRKGFISELLQKLRVKSNKNIAADVITDKALQKRMQIVFGDQQVFDDLMASVGAEGQMAQTAGAVGGSPTWRRQQAAGFDPSEMATDAVQGLAFGLPSALASGVSKRMPNVLARRTAREMLPDMMTQGTPAIDALLERLSQRGSGQAVPPWMQGQGATALGRQAPSLFGQE